MPSAETLPGNTPNQHKRVTTKHEPGFLEKLGETQVGFCLGIGLFFLSFYILFTNEGRALQTASSLDEGLHQVVSLGSYTPYNVMNNDRLVHLSSKLRTNQPLHDPNYKVVINAVKLRRQVEMYQWVEHRETRDFKEDGQTKTETTYTYNTEWKSELINSRNFDQEIGHQNPSAIPVESVTVVAPDVLVGPFSLSRGLVEQIKTFKTLSLKEFPLIYLDPFLSIHDNYFYHTHYPLRPQVGDIRVQFSYAGLSGENAHLGPPDIVSIVAKQKGEQLGSFKTKSGDLLEILYEEELSAEEVFAKEHQFNSLKSWSLRAAGWALMFIGIQLVTRIIHTLVIWIPIVRDLVSFGLNVFALCVSCSLSLLVIGVGWFFYRPLVAVALVGAALLPLLLAQLKLPAKKDE